MLLHSTIRIPIPTMLPLAFNARGTAASYLLQALTLSSPYGLRRLKTPNDTVPPRDLVFCDCTYIASEGTPQPSPYAALRDFPSDKTVHLSDFLEPLKTRARATSALNFNKKKSKCPHPQTLLSSAGRAGALRLPSHPDPEERSEERVIQHAQVLLLQPQVPVRWADQRGAHQRVGRVGEGRGRREGAVACRERDAADTGGLW